MTTFPFGPANRFHCTKRFIDFPFAHRAPLHEGHCSVIHGHNWSFVFDFGCTELDENGFVIDFGDLKWLGAWLREMFDHTTVLNADDPMVEMLHECPPLQALFNLRLVPSCSCEGIAELCALHVAKELSKRYGTRVFLTRVVVFEDSKNSTTYLPPIPSYE